MGSTRSPNMTPSSTADIGAVHPAIYLRNKLFVVEVAAWIEKRMDCDRILVEERNCHLTIKYEVNCFIYLFKTSGLSLKYFIDL